MKRIGDLLKRHKTPVVVQDDVTYKQVTIRTNYKGVVLRGTQLGSAILTKDQWRVSAGQFILSRIDARNGAFGIIPPELEGAIVTNDFLAFDINEAEVEREFFNVFLQSPLFLEACIKASRGNTNRKRVDDAFFLNFPVNLPPLSEQHRLIAKIHRARAAAGVAEREIAHQEDLVAKLKQAILQEAITGRLTAGWRAANPKLEPASQLLARIRAEKARLIAEKKVRAGARQDAVGDPASALGIPTSWELPHLDDITVLVTDGTHQTPTYTDKGRIFLSAQNVKPFRFMPQAHKYVSEAAFLEYTNNRRAEKGDLLLGRVGAGIGETAVIDQDLDFAFYVSLGLVKTFKLLTRPEYLAIVFNSPYGVRYAKGNTSSKGGSAGNFNLGRIRSFPIPFPPLAEQTEIVARVERLMERCRELEAEIARSRAHAEALVQAVLREAFAPAAAPIGIRVVRPSIKPLAYLLQFLPALVRASGGSVTLDQLNRATACLFLPKTDLLPVVERIAGSEARDHFTRFAQSYDDGAFIAAIRTLLQAKAFILGPAQGPAPLLRLTDDLPPIAHDIDADARYLASIVERVPEEIIARTAPRMETPRAREVFLRDA